MPPNSSSNDPIETSTPFTLTSTQKDNTETILDDPFEMPPNSSSNDPIETSTPFTLTSTQKDNIETILDEQIVFIKNGDIQRFLVYWVAQPDSNCNWITRDTLQ